ncbi:MAG: TetR family transcriptional regulator [Bradyrhizobium sp.]|uniref:TetR/AcrR family transcriptional regulator n=1 Tax=Bradyrhizobium sp. TaxID=376 RepID=UPI001DDEC254|nr:TetR/AcrR family transcriptional regulator [Bradyrhizobium sp.]MBV9560817.1 TetR family transcriptional regulator [Bradyrhizobium sp.]
MRLRRTANRKRAGPGQRDPDRTRAEVLSAARQEFARLGLAGARVDEIVRIAGVSKQVIYYHFSSKDELFKAALLSSYDEILANNLEYLRKAPGGSPERRLRNLIVHLFDRIGSHREVISLIVEENRYRGQHLRHSTLPYLSSKPIVEHLEEILREGAASALFKPGIDARQIFLDIFSMCLFYFTNLYTVSAVIGADLSAANEIRRRRDHIVHSVMSSLSPGC